MRKSREKAKHFFYSLQEKEKELEESNWKLEVKIDAMTRQVRKLRELYDQLKEAGYVKEGAAGGEAPPAATPTSMNAAAGKV